MELIIELLAAGALAYWMFQLHKKHNELQNKLTRENVWDLNNQQEEYQTRLSRVEGRLQERLTKDSPKYQLRVDTLLRVLAQTRELQETLGQLFPTGQFPPGTDPASSMNKMFEATGLIRMEADCFLGEDYPRQINLIDQKIGALMRVAKHVPPTWSDTETFSIKDYMERKGAVRQEIGNLYRMICNELQPSLDKKESPLAAELKPPGVSASSSAESSDRGVEG